VPATYPDVMPEGDTIHRVAARLREALVGDAVVSLEAPRARGRGPAAGERVDAVEAVGKHLLIRFSGGTTLHTHLRMHGAWDVYRPSDRWRRVSHRAQAVLRTASAVCVCFDAPIVEVLDRRDLARHPVLSSLGPDLVPADADLDAAVARMSALPPDLPVGVALIDQRVAGGIGNVFKSEVLFACGVDPRAPLSRLPEPIRRELLSTAARQLRANLGPGRRRTVPEGLAVYGRAGHPCRRCGTRIESFRQGEHARITYACFACQTVGR
jgi:endonuclease VIII